MYALVQVLKTHNAAVDAAVPDYGGTFSGTDIEEQLGDMSKMLANLEAYDDDLNRVLGQIAVVDEPSSTAGAEASAKEAKDAAE